ncbi:MAG: SUMF1/EgtB/PvdO family nonheme iron enzyme [Planctomycetota bacterium]
MKSFSTDGGDFAERLLRATHIPLDDAGLDTHATIRLEDILFGDSTPVESRTGGTLSSDLPERQIPGSKYELEDLIGRGGMGVVYRARQAALDRAVALKTSAQEAARHASKRRSFVAEAAAASRLEHPNIVPIHDLGEDPSGEVFFTMKLLEGRGWDRVIHGKDAEAVGLDEHLEVLFKVTNAVAFAHRKGYLHRDLKPENVLVGDFGEVVVMDWGLAARTDPEGDERVPHVSQAKRLAGTPAYFPPEMALGMGDRQGPWTDVYGLGGILHEILTGAPPNAGRTMKEVTRAAVEGIRTLDPKTSSRPELAEICLRALAPDPSDRYADALAFRDALIEFRRTAESRTLTDAGRMQLDTARAAVAAGDQGDDAFRRGLAALEEALSLWPENARARESERALREAWADAAEARGDLVTAANQLEAIDDPDARKRASGIRREITRREQQASSARRLRRLSVALLALLTIALAVGVWMVDRERRRTAEQERIAVAESVRSRRIASFTDARSLVTRAEEELWPITPAMIPEFEAWLREAAALPSLRDEVRARIREIEAQADHFEDVLDDRLERAYRRRESVRDGLDNWIGKAATPEEAAQLRRELRPEPPFKTLEEELAHYEALKPARRPIFTSEALRSDYDIHVAADELLGRVLDGATDDLGSIASLEERILIARRLAACRTAFTVEAWKEAIDAIRVDPIYHGLEMEPILDLCPLGRNAQGRWRFAVLASDPAFLEGAVAAPDAETFAGIVLVLIPGGKARIGNFERPPGKTTGNHYPIVEAPVLPYMIGETEVTQDQWHAVRRTRPSLYARASWASGRDPVTNVSWLESRVYCRALGLELPTEVQWEWAARAGAETRYWFGDDWHDLEGKENLKDASATGSPSDSFPWNDGFPYLSPVRTFSPNSWGLYDTVGNVTEWCADRVSGTGPRVQFKLPSRAENLAAFFVERITKGGHHKGPPALTWTIDRGSFHPVVTDSIIGLRAALTIGTEPRLFD